MIKLADFIKKYDGKYLDFDGSYGGQCVDVAKAWIATLGLPQRRGNGKDWINNAGTDCAKILYKSGLYPIEGDIVSWDGRMPYSNGYGHVAVCIKANKTTVTVFEQGTFSGKTYCRQHTYLNYNYCQGWIRPKIYQGGDIMPTTKELLNACFYTVLGRGCTDADVTAMAADEKASGISGYGPWTYVQRKYLNPKIDDLKGQITTLTTNTASLADQLTNTKKELTVQDGQIQALTQQVADLQQKLADSPTTTPGSISPPTLADWLTRLEAWLEAKFPFLK